MILRRFYDEKLAQASYLVGCGATGEAAVIDANRDVGQYLDAAAKEGLRVTAITETHIHADYVSGSRELARRAGPGATLYLSDEGDADWKYAFRAEGGAATRLVRGGDAFDVGNLRFDVVHTPGHTPEHLTFVVTDRRAAPDTPVMAFTGDFVFVGDVGRPDLLERAAGVAGAMEPGARALFRSLRRFADRVPDHVQLWPAHGAGSACGKSLGGVPVTTLGYERAANWALKETDENAFVARVLEGQPEPPTYFARMKRVNKEGPPPLDAPARPPRLAGARLPELLAQAGADAAPIVVDIRPSAAYAAGHAAGTLHLPAGKSFTNWAGWLLPGGEGGTPPPLYLLAENAAQVAEAMRDLAMIGIDDVAGWLGPDALQAAAGPPLARRTPQVAPAEAAEAALPRDGVGSSGGGPAQSAPLILDVRGRAEYAAGSIPGALHIPLGELAARAPREIPPGRRPVIVHCAAGSRSPIAASVLERLGIGPVLNMAEGFDGWKRAGLPVAAGDAPTR